MLDFFISAAHAAEPAQPSALVTFAPLVLLFVVFYFLLIRPQSKRAKEHKAMVEALQRGDEVVTSGGVLGRVADVTDNFVTLEIAAETQIQVQRHAVGNVMPKGTYKG